MKTWTVAERVTPFEPKTHRQCCGLNLRMLRRRNIFGRAVYTMNRRYGKVTSGNRVRNRRL